MKNIILGGGLVLVILVSGVAYFLLQNSTIVITDVSPTSTTTVVHIQEAGAPIVATSLNMTTSEFAASVDGTVNPHGFFTNYWFEYGMTPSMGSKTALQNIGSGYTTRPSPAYITGLSRDTKYYFRLVAQNQYGNVVGSQYSFTTEAGSPAPIGSLPTVKTIGSSSVTRTTAVLSGEITPNQVLTQYWFEYGKTSDLGNTSQFQTVSGSNGKTSIVLSVTDLDPLSTYFFRLNGQNQWGTINGATMTLRTSGPSSTLRPLADTKSPSNIRSATVTLRGSVNPNGAATVYWFEYSTDSLLGQVLLRSTARASVGAGTSDVTFDTDISGLLSNTNYFYRIVAENGVGITYGDRVAFKTK